MIFGTGKVEKANDVQARTACRTCMNSYRYFIDAATLVEWDSLLIRMLDSTELESRLVQ